MPLEIDSPRFLFPYTNPPLTRRVACSFTDPKSSTHEYRLRLPNRGWCQRPSATDPPSTESPPRWLPRARNIGFPFASSLNTFL